MVVNNKLHDIQCNIIKNKNNTVLCSTILCCLHCEHQYQFTFVEKPHKFIIAKLSTCTLGYSSLAIIYE